MSAKEYEELSGKTYEELPPETVIPTPEKTDEKKRQFSAKDIFVTKADNDDAETKRPTKTPRRPATKRAEPAAKKDEFVEPLTAIYAMVGMSVTTFAKDETCGPAIVSAAPGIAQEWQKLAEADPNVRRALRTLTKGSAWSGVIMAHFPIMMLIARHHMPALYGPVPDDDKGD